MLIREEISHFKRGGDPKDILDIGPKNPAYKKVIEEDFGGTFIGDKDNLIWKEITKSDKTFNSYLESFRYLKEMNIPFEVDKGVSRPPEVRVLISIEAYQIYRGSNDYVVLITPFKEEAMEALKILEKNDIRPNFTVWAGRFDVNRKTIGIMYQKYINSGGS